MAEELVVQESTDTLLIDGKSLHCELHSVERSRFPHVIDRETVGTFRRNCNLFTLASRSTKFQPHFIADVIWDLDHIADTL
jgi:hypothetical protein